MILIVGLGNPGKKYEKTRHNVGFRIIDVLEKEISDENIVLLRPQTFMNQSGKAVKKLISHYSLNAKPYILIVIHDDIDLPLGTIRVSQNVGSAGHKGVQSIIDELKTKNFTRVRIGIKPPLLRQGFGGQAQKFVLEKFTKEEERIIEKVMKEAVEIIKTKI